jgi:hypothetical protein
VPNDAVQSALANAGPRVETACVER